MAQQFSFPNYTTALVALFLLVMPLVAPVSLATQVVIFAAATLSVTLLLGSVGLLSFGQGLYVGVGAYVAGLVLLHSGLGLVPAILCAIVAGGALAFVLSWLVVQRQGVYFVMLTLALAQMGYFAMLSLKDYTGGENGLTGLPRSFTVVWFDVEPGPTFYSFAAACLFLAFLAVQRVNASPLGSVLSAIRQNENRSAALGYAVRHYKVAALTLAGAIGGLAGGLHSAFLGFVPPNDIEIEMSQKLLIMAIIGGVGSPAGAIVGAGFYVLMAQLLSEFWARWMALIAVLLIMIVLYLPGGLIGLIERLRTLRQRRIADV